MSEHIANELHRLYRDYYANRLALADYRYQRGLLLDSLADDVLDAQTIPRREAAELQPATVSDAPVRSSEARRFRWPYVAAVCIPLFALVVFFVTKELDTPVMIEPAKEGRAAVVKVMEDTYEPEPLVAPEVEIVPDVGQVLTEEFVARDDWREPSLKEFQETWGRLPASDRIVAKGSVWFAPLVAGLRYQIAEAVEFSDDPANDAHLSSLYQFSLNLGLPELLPAGWRPQQPKPVVQKSSGTAAPVPNNSTDSQRAASDPEASVSGKSIPAATENTCRVSQLQSRRRSCKDLLDDGSNGPSLIVLAAGSFGDDKVVDAPFAISIREISRREFEQYCESVGVTCPDDPWPGEDMPVVNISWNEASAYCVWLSEMTGYHYRLPNETEWEYAARAGSDSEYPFGEEITPAMARYSGLATYDRPLPTIDTTTRRNDFGLWHVVGNVREWVAPDNLLDDEARAVRGGSYADSEKALRFRAFEYLAAADRDAQTGFRVLREL